jgi:uncharacterized protein (DUF488 family)
MEKNPLYSIGHGRRKIEDFVALLKQYKITHLADVRSMPLSRFNPQYNRNRLQQSLAENGIAYLFMGDELGGRPKEASCYNEKGRVDYDRVKAANFFRKGIKQLSDAYKEDLRLAIMCSESKPCDCHRSRLIGTALKTEGIPVVHIDEKGGLQTQEYVEKSWLPNAGMPTLFDI